MGGGELGWGGGGCRGVAWWVVVMWWKYSKVAEREDWISNSRLVGLRLMDAALMFQGCLNDTIQPSISAQTQDRV